MNRDSDFTVLLLILFIMSVFVNETKIIFLAFPLLKLYGFGGS